MLDRVKVQVVHVMPEIGLVPDLVFPVTMLPKSAATFGRAVRRKPVRPEVTGAAGASHEALDQAPAGRKIRIVFRQSPDGMQVIREQNPAIDAEGVFYANSGNGLAQSGTNIRRDQDRMPALRHHREKVASPRRIHPPISRHKHLQYAD